jgi:hypothetical protein
MHGRSGSARLLSSPAWFHPPCHPLAVVVVQVFDLSQQRPDKVLKQLWENFAEQEAQGNARAGDVRKRLRILACGGDGTIAWILKVVRDLNLRPAPAVAIMPLGTGRCHAFYFALPKRFLLVTQVIVLRVPSSYRTN